MSKAPEMIEMVVTNRRSTLVIASTNGRSYAFVPDKPSLVLPEDVELCMERGVGFVNADDEPLLDGSAPVERRVPTQKELVEKMTSLFNQMVANPDNHREGFTAGGRPQVKYTTERIGFDVTVDAIAQVWRNVLKAKDATAG